MKHLKLYEAFIAEKEYTREDMRALLGSPEDISLEKDFLKVKALLWIYKYQTPGEKESYTTDNLNGVGFSGPDAFILTSFAKQVVEKQFLSEKQMAILRRKIGKYAGQMARISTEISNGRAQKDSAIEGVMAEWRNKNSYKYSY
jgi:hypothetical protein